MLTRTVYFRDLARQESGVRRARIHGKLYGGLRVFPVNYLGATSPMGLNPYKKLSPVGLKTAN